MKYDKRSVGRWGERLAAQYLEQHHFTILERNVRTPYGEIDLIACKDGVTVFIEVKTRKTKSFGLPEESVNQRKQMHMLSSAQHYIQEHDELEGAWRIDVIAIRQFKDGNPPQITHFENAVRS
jgi:putative endonuclease